VNSFIDHLHFVTTNKCNTTAISIYSSNITFLDINHYRVLSNAQFLCFEMELTVSIWSN
jgi:hypothetical protein